MTSNIEVYTEINYSSRAGIVLKGFKTVVPMFLSSGTSGKDKPRKRNQEMGTRKQSPTQERAEGNFHDGDDGGGSQRQSSAARLRNIKSTHPGGIASTLLTETEKLFDKFECTERGFIIWQKVWS